MGDTIPQKISCSWTVIFREFCAKVFLRGGLLSFKTGCISIVILEALAKLRVLLDYVLQKSGFVLKPGDFTNKTSMFFPLIGQHVDHLGHRPAGTC